MEKKTLNSGCVLAATGFGSNLFLEEHAYIHRTGDENLFPALC